MMIRRMLMIWTITNTDIDISYFEQVNAKVVASLHETSL